MRQIFLETPGKFSERDAPKPAVKPGEALVRIEKVGICGSDFHAFHGKHFAYTYPRIIGHEVSCTVVEVPENTRGIKVGDHCALEPYVSCGKCFACATGNPNCCEVIHIYGIHMDGGMQGFLSVPVHLLHRSDTLSLDALALVETLGIGAHAVVRSGLKEGEQAIVVGAGPIGLAVAQCAQAAGAKVHVVERNEERLKFVESLGFSGSSQGGDMRAAAVFDATGNPHAMAASFNFVAIGGRLTFVGLTTDPIAFDDTLFHKREMTLYASRNSKGLFPRIIRLLEEDKIDARPWVSERLALRDVGTQFPLLLKRPNLIKAIVDIEESDL